MKLKQHLTPAGSRGNIWSGTLAASQGAPDEWSRAFVARDLLFVVDKMLLFKMSRNVG
jgi:hypothetical protein